MYSLILAIVCSVLISVFMRIGTNRVDSKTGMLASNYACCIIIGAISAAAGGSGFSALSANPAVPLMLLFAVINGSLFLGAFLLLQANIRKNGVVLSTTFSKLGLLVPMVVSIFLFKEIPTFVQIIGFVIAIFSIIFMNKNDGKGSKASAAGLIILLLACGSADTMSKIYDELGDPSLSSLYLLFSFAVSLLFCLFIVLIKKEKLGRKELIYGFLLGIPNYFSVHFMLGSLATVPAVIVYPTYSVATILFVSLAGVLIFHEKLEKRQWFILGSILVAVALLNM